MSSLARFFSENYAQARQTFVDAARGCNAQPGAEIHPGARGAQGEPLSMDTALLGGDGARALLIVTSGTHGAEGFAGSGCQVALMHDADLLERLRRAGLALLLVHAVNPYGFSHLRRVNEDNVDLNRNFLLFDAPLPASPGYTELHDLLLPREWPPSPANRASILEYIGRHGLRAFQRAVTTGQSTHADGLFYSGAAPTWSNRALRSIVRAAGCGRASVGWIDLHTGLGPCGHGEKIYAGRAGDGLVRARRWWGADVVSPADGESASEDVRGPAMQCAYDECPQAEITAMALEFGTLPLESILDALRGDHWLARNAAPDPGQRARIKQALRQAFYVDSDEWRGMVAAQARVAVLQACAALSVLQ